MAKKLHVRTGDEVMVISGKDAGLKGKILRAMPEEGRVVVAGANMVTKHQKARGANQPAGIVKTEAPIYASKVMVVCPKCGKPARMGTKVMEDGSKARVCKKCHEILK